MNTRTHTSTHRYHRVDTVLTFSNSENIAHTPALWLTHTRTHHTHSHTPFFPYFKFITLNYNQQNNIIQFKFLFPRSSFCILCIHSFLSHPSATSHSHPSADAFTPATRYNVYFTSQSLFLFRAFCRAPSFTHTFIFHFFVRVLFGFRKRYAEKAAIWSAPFCLQCELRYCRCHYKSICAVLFRDSVWASECICACSMFVPYDACAGKCRMCVCVCAYV